LSCGYAGPPITKSGLLKRANRLKRVRLSFARPETGGPAVILVKGYFVTVIASVSQRSNPLKTKRLLRQKTPRNDCNFIPNEYNCTPFGALMFTLIIIKGEQKVKNFF
jgi:hypothetical protein